MRTSVMDIEVRAPDEPEAHAVPLLQSLFPSLCLSAPLHFNLCHAAAAYPAAAKL